MAVISTANHPKSLWPGVRAWVMTVYKEYPEEFSQVFEVLSSSKAYEEDVESTAFDLAQIKPEGSAIAYTSNLQGATKRYTHITYALGFMVTMEEQEDNQYRDKAFNRGALMARSFRLTKEIVHWNVLNRAFNSSYTGIDAKELIATDHPTLAGNQSNELSTAADLSEAALEDLLIMIRLAKNSKGQPIALKGQKLIVSAYDQFNAERILKSTLQNDTANNAVNAVKSMGMLPGGYMVGTYLTDTDAWFVKTDAPNGLISFNRKGFTVQKDNDFDTKNDRNSGIERYSCGWTDWRGLYGSDGSGT